MPRLDALRTTVPAGPEGPRFHRAGRWRVWGERRRVTAAGETRRARARSGRFRALLYSCNRQPPGPGCVAALHAEVWHRPYRMELPVDARQGGGDLGLPD